MRSSAPLTRLAVVLLSLVLSGCILEKNHIVDLHTAENILITSNNRLIVTGGTGIFEVKKDGGDSRLVRLFQGIVKEEGGFGKWNVNVGEKGCSFTGMAQYENWLFATCVSIHNFGFLTVNHLLYADLDPDNPNAPLKFEKVDMTYAATNSYNTLSIPNGMAAMEFGDLMVANSDYGPIKSGIAKVGMDYSGAIPRVLYIDSSFVSPSEHNTVNPNGVRIDNGYLYFSDAGKVKRAKILGDGSISTHVETMWKNPLPNLIDDIMPYCGGVLMTDFISGQLHYVATVQQDLNDDSKDIFVPIYSTIPLNYSGPSSVAIGPVDNTDNGEDDGLVKKHEILVTQKVSSKLVSTPIYFEGKPVDLTSPDTCAEIDLQARKKI